MFGSSFTERSYQLSEKILDSILNKQLENLIFLESNEILNCLRVGESSLATILRSFPGYFLLKIRNMHILDDLFFLDVHALLETTKFVIFLVNYPQ